LNVEIKGVEGSLGNTKPNSNGVWQTEVKLKFDMDPEILKELATVLSAPGALVVTLDTPQMGLSEANAEPAAPADKPKAKAKASTNGHLSLEGIAYKVDNDPDNTEPYACTLNEFTAVGATPRAAMVKLLAEGPKLLKRKKAKFLEEGDYTKVKVDDISDFLSEKYADTAGMDTVIAVIQQDSFAVPA